MNLQSSRPHSWEVAELGQTGKVKIARAGSETHELAILWLGNLDICLGKMQSNPCGAPDFSLGIS